MSDQNYGSIFTSEYEALEPVDEGTPISKRSALAVALATVCVAGVFGAAFSQRYGSLVYPSGKNLYPDSYPDSKAQSGNFPSTLMKLGGILDGRPDFKPEDPNQSENFPNFVPVNTRQAIERGWVKSEDKACDEMLGEEWLYGGERAIDTSVTVYFTPQVGDDPGVATAVEVDYYDFVEPNLTMAGQKDLTKVYFSGPHVNSKSEEYHSVAVLLRKPDDQGVCDTTKAVKNQTVPYVAIAPALANKIVPILENDTELIDGWKEGACINYMGYHWASDVIGGKDLTYEMGNLVPVVPMYGPDKSINGIFFVAVGLKQKPFRPSPECMPYTNQAYSAVNTTKCFVDNLNFWDSFPLSLNNNILPPNKFCTNFCGECNFTNSKFGDWVTTMHFLFKDTIREYNQGKYQCKQEDEYGSCRNNNRSYLPKAAEKNGGYVGEN